jgi:large subunit ribosomal protein L25
LELLDINANIRTTAGNSPSRGLRREGSIPAVLYGPGAESVLLSINAHDLELALKRAPIGQIIFNLQMQNADFPARTAIAKEIQIHPVSRNFLHVDFYEISKDRKILAKVPVAVRGKAKGVENGGILQIILREVEVSCLPFEVPDAIPVDISNLDIGDSIHIGDIPKIENVDFADDAHITVLTISSSMVDDRASAEKTEEAEVAPAPAAPGKKSA